MDQVYMFVAANWYWIASVALTLIYVVVKFTRTKKDDEIYNETRKRFPWWPWPKRNDK